ncbi:polysaccharide deacetylase family protein [Phenylobacterium aquaticum]|uniref:polysaccharide deacetylase family protein n=1 Tax=Phenylobacterium aquaticum TaxID=1763816 RepID=UPI0026E9A161|nr:polysaccharide deacetylase family protein [Phenylobacterium aquaticum]
MRSKLLPLLGALGALVWTHAARAEGVALTYDDLPGFALTDSVAYEQLTTDRLLRGIKRHHFQATGFVIGDRLDGDNPAAHRAMVVQWRDAGLVLGNHTNSHESLNKTPVADYIADVAQADAVLRPILAARGQTPVWFRHPYLETGTTAEARKAFEDWLAAHAYKVAPVTMENSDWMFALVYDNAILHHDRAKAARVKRIYLSYTEKCVAWYRSAGLQLLGRRPDYVFLLHATRLNADTVGDLARILKRNHLRPEPLARAMADPAYQIADTRGDPDGDEWLSRWSVTLHKDLPWDSFPDPPADISAENDRLDTP